MWKKKLPSPVRAAIAGMCMQTDLEAILAKADDVFASLNEGARVSAVNNANGGNNANDNAAQTHENGEEVAAYTSNRSRGRGFNPRGNQRGRGQRRGRGHGGNGGNGQRNQQQQNSVPRRNWRHPDNPPENCCPTHLRFGHSAWSCTGANCPWKDITTTPPQQ